MTATALALARRCRAARCTGPDGLPRHLPDERLVCDGCAERGRADIAGLPRRYAALRVALRYRGTAGEKISGPGFASSPPLRAAALSCMEDLTAWATLTDSKVREAMSWRSRPYNMMRPAKALVEASQSLLTLWHRALIYEPGIVAVDGSFRLRVRADQILGWSRLVHRLPAPCPYCDTLTLVRDDGKDFVRCTACRRNWREAEYRLFVRMLVDEARS
ncbi:hypothetical protein AB0P21_09595 [Kribbella sp. NPDC056861]|uniref:hypothetical protein n=1 Tax=Kribbella sp. NPDC056861 TaxID=3154857 RepID=UPI0034404628